MVFWARAQRIGSCAAARSGAYLRWRYERGGEGHYCFASAWRGDDMGGARRARAAAASC